MKRTFACLLSFAAIAAGSAAQAVPIYFDFTGTMTNGSGTSQYDGQPFTAQLRIESAGFDFVERSARNPLVDTHSQLASGPGPGLMSLDLTIGGNRIPFDFAYNSGYVRFWDSCEGACEPYQSEQFDLGASSSDSSVLAGPPADGASRTNSFYFAGLGDPGLAFIDRADVFDVASIARLPFATSFGSLRQSVDICEAGSCTQTVFASTDFQFTSITRRVGDHSIPEPGTLGLLGVGLVGVWAMRRRRTG